MHKQFLLVGCAVGALGFSAGSALADTAAASAGSASATNNATTVGDLVVVAERREQNLQKAPVAVSVFTGAQRDLVGINTVQDVTNFAPGFTYSPVSTHAYIRGVGRQSASVTNDARVSAYEDEFYFYSTYGLDKSSLFLSQEQIERGPQNIGGRNSDGGSIDMISVRPTDQPYAEFRATVANYDTYNVEGAVSGQVAPGLDLRLAAYDHNQGQGWYTNVAGGPSEGNVLHEWYVEGQLQAKLGDNADLWVRAFDSGWNNRGDAGARNGFENGSWDETNLTDANASTGGALFVNGNYGYAALPGAARNAVMAAGTPASLIPVAGGVTLINPNIFNNPSITNPNHFAAPIPDTVTVSNYADLNYIFTYHFPKFDLKYIGGWAGYAYTLNEPGEDSDVSSFTLPGNTAIYGAAGSQLVINPLPIENYKEDDQWTSQEISLASTDDSKLQWIGGAYFFYQHYSVPLNVAAPDQPQLSNPMNASLTGLAAPNPGNDFFYASYDIGDWSEAGYGQASYKFNDQFKLTVSGRYTNDYKSGVEAAREVDFSSAIIGALSKYYGAATPALDVTVAGTCPTGVASSCYSGPLAPGVSSIAVVGANGVETRALAAGSAAWTGGADLEWTPNDDIFVYARYNRGYEDLTFNSAPTNPIAADPVVAPEYINSYEIGYKQAIGRDLTIDIDAFYYDYEDLQLPISVVTPAGTVGTSFVNVPKSMSAGIEFESYWQPIKDMLVTFSYSYDDTSVLTGCSGTVTAGAFTANPGALCLVDTNDPDAVAPGAHPAAGQAAGAAREQGVNGAPLPEAPRNKLALSVAYTWRFDPGSLTLTGAYAWRDAQDGTVFNRSYDNAPAWDDVDLRVDWKGRNDRYEVIGFIKNIFNTLQYEQGVEGAGLLGNATSITTAAAGLDERGIFELAPPRTFGVEFRYKFF